jgi:hypothetical protein
MATNADAHSSSVTATAATGSQVGVLGVVEVVAGAGAVAPPRPVVVLVTDPA